MDRRRNLIPMVLMTVLVVAACASTPDRIAYTSISGAVDGVQAALKAWNEVFYSPGVKVDPALWNARRDKLADAYAKFQASAALAVTLAKDVTQGDNALKIVNDAAAQVLALIAELEKK
jgi:hypothetical protein